MIMMLLHFGRRELLFLLSVIVFLLSFLTLVCSNVSETHHGGTEIFELSTLCAGHFPSQMHRRVDGAVIASTNDKNLDCEVTFSAEYVSQRFLITFTQFNMECGDRLHIYDSANAIGSSRAELSCRFLGPEDIPPIRTRGHYVTLKFTADNWGTPDNKFTMVITSFKDPSQGCRDAFLCGPDMCITNRLLCDKVQNCLDGSDELRSANCTSNLLDLLTSSVDSPLKLTVFCGVGVTLLLSLFCCLCYSNSAKNPAPAQAPDIYNHGKLGRDVGAVHSGSNGTGTLLSLSEKGVLGGVAPGGRALQLSQKSGNWDLPAESQGYLPLRLLLQCSMAN